MRSGFAKILIAFALAGRVAITAGDASATTVCLGGDLGSPSCTAGDESMIFLDSASDVMTGTGHIGSHLLLPAVQFTSDSSLDFADGFATITPSAKGGKASFGDLEFTIPGRTFTDLVFDLQMAKADTTDLTIEAIDGTTLVQSFDLTGLKHDEDLIFHPRGDWRPFDGNQLVVDEWHQGSQAFRGFRDRRHSRTLDLGDADPWFRRTRVRQFPQNEERSGHLVDLLIVFTATWERPSLGRPLLFMPLCAARPPRGTAESLSPTPSRR